MDLNIGLGGRDDVSTSAVRRRMHSSALGAQSPDASTFDLQDSGGASDDYEPVPLPSFACRSATEVFAMPQPATFQRPVRSSGVDAPSNGEMAAFNRVQRSPRLSIKPLHAVIVILVLVAALCASLTLLVQQSINFSSQQAVLRAAHPATSNARTNPPGNRPKSHDDPGQTTTQNTSRSDKEHAAESSRSASGPQTNGDDNLIDLNTADAQDLQRIKGVGPVTAKRIIEYRTSVGRFTSVDDLLNVKGIGQKTLGKMRSQVKT
ncbi:competence protein ComEA [Bifidobacterium bohemicum]|nr:competence protein ComEA [Bifidobacterium bohemicum]